MLKIFLFLVCARLTLTICGPKQTMINHGRQLCCRNDTDGVPTIGIRYKLTRNDSETVMLTYNLTLSNVLSDCQRNTSKYCLTNDQAEEIFYKISYREATECADKYVSNLPPMKRNAIIDVAATSCRALNTFVKMKKALLMNNWTEAAEELKDSRWCSQVRQRRCTEDYDCIRNDESYPMKVSSPSTSNSLINSKCYFVNISLITLCIGILFFLF